MDEFDFQADANAALARAIGNPGAILPAEDSGGILDLFRSGAVSAGQAVSDAVDAGLSATGKAISTSFNVVTDTIGSGVESVTGFVTTNLMIVVAIASIILLIVLLT